MVFTGLKFYFIKIDKLATRLSASEVLLILGLGHPVLHVIEFTLFRTWIKLSCQDSAQPDDDTFIWTRCVGTGTSHPPSRAVGPWEQNWETLNQTVVLVFVLTAGDAWSDTIAASLFSVAAEPWLLWGSCDLSPRFYHSSTCLMEDSTHPQTHACWAINV